MQHPYRLASTNNCTITENYLNPNNVSLNVILAKYQPEISITRSLELTQKVFFVKPISGCFDIRFY